MDDFNQFIQSNNDHIYIQNNDQDRQDVTPVKSRKDSLMTEKKNESDNWLGICIYNYLKLNYLNFEIY